MKKNKANGLAATINRTPLRKVSKSVREQLTGTLQIQQSGLTEVRNVPPPSEEVVNRLNALGREYPFCVINKPGNHLIL
jgi:hypothetical protein